MKLIDLIILPKKLSDYITSCLLVQISNYRNTQGALGVLILDPIVWALKSYNKLTNLFACKVSDIMSSDQATKIFAASNFAWNSCVNYLSEKLNYLHTTVSELLKTCINKAQDTANMDSMQSVITMFKSESQHIKSHPLYFSFGVGFLYYVQYPLMRDTWASLGYSFKDFGDAYNNNKNMTQPSATLLGNSAATITNIGFTALNFTSLITPMNDRYKPLIAAGIITQAFSLALLRGRSSSATDRHHLQHRDSQRSLSS